MKIDRKVVQKVADLSRIAIREEDFDTITAELNKILTFMEKLNELDTSHVRPLVYMNENTNVWREDVAENGMSTAAALKNAALHTDQFFLVPKVIDQQKANN